MKRSFAVFGATGALIVLGAIFFRPAASAEVPRTPHDDAEILEHLATGASDPRENERARLGTILAAQPRDLRTAVALAHLDIEISRARSDPRYLSYAQAALAPWWEQADAPPEVLILRATIRQSVHGFDAALVDLDRVVAVAPYEPQGWVTRSVVLAVRGRYEEARASCAPLARLSSPLVFTVCETSIDGVTGSAGPAYARLAAMLEPGNGRAVRLTPGEIEWATSTLGEIALRSGHDGDAEQKFKASLAIDPEDAYVLAAYADLLLDLDRPKEAAKLVEGRTDNDGLLLRLALAENKTRGPLAAAHAELLATRFDASHLRGDTVHRREEARFRLGLQHDAAAALTLARANWDVQREPWDVRILLESALAASDPAAAKPALSFLDEHHLEDPRILAVAAQLKKGEK
jgi:tetratricopeptide (TPR) repeat protein